VATNCEIGSAYRQLNTSTSEDPASWTISAAPNGWSAWVVAIHPQRPHYGSSFQDPAVFAKARDVYKRLRSGIFVPKLWLPEGAVV
jgi:hypothetical protein